jgi:hypothetical protein
MRLGLQSGFIPLGLPDYNDIFVLCSLFQVCYVPAHLIWHSISLIKHGKKKNTNYVYPYYVLFDSLFLPVAWIQIYPTPLCSRPSLFWELPSRCQTDGHSLSNTRYCSFVSVLIFMRWELHASQSAESTPLNNDDGVKVLGLLNS